jgi:hypothetical protein
MVQSIAYYSGFRLIETTAITKQVQRRTHRKHRINKKWLKKYGYKTVLDDGRVVQFGDCLLATPNTIKKIIEATKENDNEMSI